MGENLEMLRSRIDEIDRKMVDLFRERMEICAQVAEYKSENGLPILAPERERALLAKVSDQAGEELAGYAQCVYGTILSVSRAYQENRIGERSQG